MAKQYDARLETDRAGNLDVARLPYGAYRFQISHPGFAPVAETVTVRSSIQTSRSVVLRMVSVHQTVVIDAAATLLDSEEPGNVDQIGSSFIQRRLASVPGRSLQDLINSQPGWLYEGNAVLHPRGSEYQTQFVVDGIPLTDNRSPSFGPEIEADDVRSLSIYTAGIPAEYGRKIVSRIFHDRSDLRCDPARPLYRWRSQSSLSLTLKTSHEKVPAEK